MKNIFKIIMLMLLMLPTVVSFAEDRTVDTYYEFGRRGAQALVEEEDLSDEFNYIKYNIKYSEELSPKASYYFKYQYYNKDYDSQQNLRNTFNSTGFGVDTVFYSNDIYTAKISPDFEFKSKVYPNAKENSYNQIKLDVPIIFKKECDWSVKLAGGINYYEYPDSPKDQFKSNARIDVSKYFLDERLIVSSFYKFQYIDRETLQPRKENNYGLSGDLKLDSKFIKGIEADIEQGEDNTIIFEEREDSHDFRYTNWFIKTRHSFVDGKIDTSLKYLDMQRTYTDFNHNYGGFLIENPWTMHVFDTKKEALDLRLTFMHKQFRYPYVASPFAFHNDNIFTVAEFTMKKNWKTFLESDVRFYNYPGLRFNDKIYYIENFGIEKYFEKDLTLGCDYRFTYKEFLHKPTILENIIRIRANFKF